MNKKDKAQQIKITHDVVMVICGEFLYLNKSISQIAKQYSVESNTIERILRKQWLNDEIRIICKAAL